MDLCKEAPPPPEDAANDRENSTSSLRVADNRNLPLLLNNESSGTGAWEMIVVVTARVFQERGCSGVE